MGNISTILCGHRADAPISHTDSPVANTWADEILQGVTILPAFWEFGEMANMLIWGENAKPILTGAYQPADIAIAAAELAGGRVVALTNIRYGLHFLNDDDEEVSYDTGYDSLEMQIETVVGNHLYHSNGTLPIRFCPI